MPRRPRVTLAGVPLHLIQRGSNRQACFFSEEDCRAYLDWLEEYAQASACTIHAYVLMTNHVHLLLTPHPFYTALGNDHKARQAAYRELFRYQLDPGVIDEIRVATNGNFALGSPRFQAQIAAVLGRRVAREKPGRPRNRSEAQSSGLFDRG